MSNKYYAALFITCLMALTACNHSSEAPSPAPTTSKDVVDTVTVHPSQVTDTLTLPARLMPNPTDVVHIYPPLSGRVLTLKALPGQEVSKGQAIGTLQSNDGASARSDYEKAKIEAARADLQLQRAKELLQHEVMAQKDYDDLKAVGDADHAELQRTLQTLHNLGFSENDSSVDLPIRSPISGIVLDVGTAPGELQRSLDNANAIATIANIDSIWVIGDLYPNNVDAVRRGQPVEVRVNGYPNEVRSGVIDNISDAVDPTTLTLKVRVVLANPGHKYKPQMFATISVANLKREAIVVPSTAVIRDGIKNYVFVATPDHKYARRDVELGETHENAVEITHGLGDGEQIVSTGAELLRQAGAQ
ncbi:efflux RND transporter periplasmic adaptor subunit [Alloacidobacterium sp.]|uniref:efflux RND transporter periplasmic adaptor subunit n=1 Tax=Alloacidobacterium sp. TaxID=2951999 RepID=UPI002D692D7D|nr:efflux RND transporter periplasmic adaptor subunit [Alloacidobacterium sp.]HYK38336.1 efflux RND transporter periplasmic adaptor subunit [Alloacidobacterium sp.]